MNVRLTVDPREIDGELLLAIARDAVAERFGAAPRAIPPRSWLNQHAATFVTLHLVDGDAPPRLQGCIGSVEPSRALVDDVRHNAVMAAFRDPRFRPLRSDQLAHTQFEVSVLGPRAPVEFVDEADARAKLRPGVDGLILTFDGYRGLFLPQVWDALPDPADFLDQLKRKAGLPARFWSPAIQLDRFEVIKFREAPKG